MERMMYNTILGAKPMQRDGRSFYYSDYNFQGKKEYCDHRWPCCSGTMPQVAADYRINTYFRDPRAVYVNLYIPSTVKWKQGGAHVALTQKTEYPFDSVVQFKVETSKPVDFALNLRIPEWTKGATISVNGKRLLEVSSAGRFMAVERRWKNGDRVELDMPLGMRLQPIDAEHPKTVALMQGPLVLFPLEIRRRTPRPINCCPRRKLAHKSGRLKARPGRFTSCPSPRLRMRRTRRMCE